MVIVCGFTLTYHWTGHYFIVFAYYYSPCWNIVLDQSSQFLGIRFINQIKVSKFVKKHVWGEKIIIFTDMNMNRTE